MDTTGGLEVNCQCSKFFCGQSFARFNEYCRMEPHMNFFPADCYQLAKSSVDIPANERLLKGELTYDPAKIQELLRI